MSRRPVSVIIPAHNESAVIRATLAALLNGPHSELLDVTVACNGCSDDTADVVARDWPNVRVLQLTKPSKIGALNAADRVARNFPRFYLDADVRVSADSILEIATAIQSTAALAAGPVMTMDTSRSGWLVRAYYRVWQTMPYVQEGMIGAGVYALSDVGRARFEQFPDLIADDGYIRQLFAPEERTVVRSAHSIVTAPHTVQSLLKIKTRSRLGLRQLRSRYPELSRREARSKRYGLAALSVIMRPWLWPALPVYLLVNLAARYRAGRQWRRMAREPYVWERDTSSRSPAKPRGAPTSSVTECDPTRAVA